MSTSSDTLSPRPSPAAPKPATSQKRKAAAVPEIEVDLALPAPPSKKAKRALKKGKPPPPTPASDAYPDDDNNADNNNNNNNNNNKKRERAPHGVWIGNLRFTVTRADLRAWLVAASGGAIADAAITRVHLPPARRGPAAPAFENRGFAYVDFATAAAAAAAVALSESEWHRRRLLIKDAGNYAGRPAAPKPGPADAPADAPAPVSVSRKVFVGNLGFQTAEEDVRALFAKCGEIEWVKVATFEDSGKCKGYGWVKFAEAAAADWAVKGFVKIKEVEETEEDFIGEEEAKAASSSSSSSDDDKDDSEASSSDSGSDAGSDDSDGSDSAKASEANSSSSSSDPPPSSNKKPTPTPAKKTGKAAPAAVPEKKIKTRKWWVNTLHGRRLKIEHAEDDQTRYKKRFKKRTPDAAPTKAPAAAAAAVAPPRPGAFSKNSTVDIGVARLTGAPVKSEGKRTTF